MPQFSRWTRPQRRGLLFFALVFVVEHFLLFFVSQVQQHNTFTPLAWHAYSLDLPKSLVDTIRSRVAQNAIFKPPRSLKNLLAYVTKNGMI